MRALPSIHEAAKALGGEVVGGGILAPGPHHSAADRSLSVRLDAAAPDGFIINSFAGDDWQPAKDHVRARLGLPSWQPQVRAPAREFIYRAPTGEPHIRVNRVDKPGGGKDFWQEHWTGRGWHKSLNGAERVLYRLPELLAADPAETVYLVEGEKCADALAAQGFLATTNLGGASQPWRDDYSAVLEGRRIVILPDNDDPGRQHANKIAKALEGRVASLNVMTLPGLPPKGDVVDWLDAGGTREELERLCRPQHRASQFYSAASLKGKPIPQRDWLVSDLVPMNTVTLFSGDGGTGKSLLGLQLAVAAAAGENWLERSVRQGNVIVLSAEDDDDELHRRLDDILFAAGRSYDDIAGLTLRSLAGEDALLAVESQLSLMKTTLFEELEARAADEAPSLVIIDTLADVYPANENDRMKVRQFIGILRGLAIRQRCAVMLLGHPSLTGLSSGTGASGSTAWNNSVRSRLYLSRVIVEDYESNPDRRLLTTKKANYGRIGGEIALTWRGGVFVADAEPSSLDRMAAGAKAERVFLELLDEITAQGRRVNAAGGTHYAPKVFADHPSSEGVNKRAFRAAMETLLASHKVVVAEGGPPSRRVSFLERAGA